MILTLIITLIIIIGAIIGYLFIPGSYETQMDTMILVMLNVMLLSVGISIGKNKNVYKKILKQGLTPILIPLGTIIGSLIGGLIVGFLLNVRYNQSLAIASGFGWYTLSAGILKGISGDEIGAIAFVSNVVREMFAIIFIPLLCKKLSPYTAISASGATSMDTTLPIIAKFSREDYAVVSFLHGMIISTLVPLLVPFFAIL